MAPISKPPGQRRRRNAEQPQWRRLPVDGEAPQAPDLPGDWLPSTIEWWAEIWRSPMASAWLPADVGALRRLARLRDADERGQGVAVALPAMQQLEDRFGLNPKARRNLQWEVAQAQAAQPPPKRASAAGGRQLRAVDAAG